MKRLTAVLFLLSLAGCGTSAEPGYYTLNPVFGTAMPGPTVSLKVQRPGLPAYLDRPEIVRQQAYRMEIDDTRHWAEPLDKMFERVLAADLRQRLPAAVVTEEQSGLSPQACMVLTVEIATFNETETGARLTAQAELRNICAHGPDMTAPIMFDEKAGGGDTPEALSALTGKLADRIASRLQERKTDAP